MSERIFITGANRTAVGRMGGTLSGIPAKELAEITIKEALKRSGLKPEDIDFVYFGNVLQAGSGQNVARQASVNAGIPVTTPAVTLNIICGSGLEAVNTAARMIKAGDADVVLCGGTENMSMAPYLLTKGRYGYRMGDATILDSMTHDALTDAFHEYHMGITAENIAERWHYSREDLDRFACESQNRAEAAQKEGRFQDEIVPVEVKQKKENVVFDQDEGIRYGQTVEQLAKLRPAFKKDGVVTAGNSSGINDGAACMILISESKMKELGIQPQVEYVAGAVGGVDPAIMGTGPIEATKRLMKKMNCDIKAFDLVEANEAFAAQSLVCQDELGLDPAITNVNGGAIAIGHPVGCSGSRILVTLIYEFLRRKEAKQALATLCVGGGMGVATCIRKVEE